MDMETTTKGAEMFTSQTDRLGMTEREWDNLFSSRSQNDGAQTAHCSKFDDESFCELCDSPVVYNGPSDIHGTCGCDH